MEYGATPKPAAGFVQHLPAPAQASEAPFTKPYRRRLNYAPILLTWILPWLFFWALYWAMTCEFRWKYPGFALKCSVFSLLVVVVGVVFVLSARFNLNPYLVDSYRGAPDRQPTWSIFLLLTTLFAWVAAVILGNSTYATLGPYYEQMTMAHYTNVQTTSVDSFQFMDAGSVQFAAGTHLDYNKAMGFKNGRVYCVAPITSSSTTDAGAGPASYDWWAVGVDCCTPQGQAFTCDGAYDPSVNGGMRLMDAKERYWYELAVQEANAAHHIKTFRPLFFHWVHDPITKIDNWKETGDSQFLFWVPAYCAFQLALVVVAVLTFGHLWQQGAL